MCRKCNKEIDSEYLVLDIDGDELRIDYNAYSCDSSFNEKVSISYCPMCGVKLKPKE